MLPVVIHSSLTGTTNENHVKNGRALMPMWRKFVPRELADTIRSVLPLHRSTDPWRPFLSVTANSKSLPTSCTRLRASSFNDSKKSLIHSRLSPAHPQTGFGVGFADYIDILNVTRPRGPSSRWRWTC